MEAIAPHRLPMSRRTHPRTEFRPLQPPATSASASDRWWWSLFGLAAIAAVAATVAACAAGFGPPEQRLFATREGEVVRVETGGIRMALLGLGFAALWWLPAFGAARRRRWGVYLGIGSALVTLLCTAGNLLIAVVAAPGSPVREALLLNQWDWALPIVAAIYLGAALRWHRLLRATAKERSSPGPSPSPPPAPRR